LRDRLQGTWQANVVEGTDKLTSPDKRNLANFHQATAVFHSLNALILRFR